LYRINTAVTAQVASNPILEKIAGTKAQGLSQSKCIGLIGSQILNSALGTSPRGHWIQLKI